MTTKEFNDSVNRDVAKAQETANKQLLDAKAKAIEFSGLTPQEVTRIANMLHLFSLRVRLGKTRLENHAKEAEIISDLAGDFDALLDNLTELVDQVTAIEKGYYK